MRVFWALMAALILAGGVVLLVRERPSATTTPTMAETAVRSAPPAVKTPVEPETEPVSAGEDAEVAKEEAAKEETDETPGPQSVEVASEPRTVAQVDASDAVEESAPEEAVPVVVVVEDVEPGTGETPAPPAAGASETPASPEPAVAVTTREDIAPRKPAPEEGVRPDAVERREDGTYLIGGTHVVTGEGTVEKPFEVSWEMLISASRVYRPKQGKHDLPEWAGLLNGKQVRITGFIAFPFVADAASECLLMLNQWDGCCIGVPPTPYDAVEVKLGVPLDLTRQAINYGSIRGVFTVDPYLVNDFLVGLYVMDDGVVEAAAARDVQGY